MMVRVFAHGLGDLVQFQIKSFQRLKKLFSMPPCLTLCIIRNGSRVKWGKE